MGHLLKDVFTVFRLIFKEKNSIYPLIYLRNELTFLLIQMHKPAVLVVGRADLRFGRL